MIISVKQSKARKLMDIILTLLGWLFLITFLYNLVLHFEFKISFQFNSLSINSTNSILLFTIMTILISAVALVGWLSFNKRRYGSLKRRKFPGSVHAKEIAVSFQVTEEEVNRFQEQRYIDRE